MNDLSTIEIKPFIPSKDFETSKDFYSALGFECKWSDNSLAYFAFENTTFLLQNFYLEAHAENYMIHLLVNSADAWWKKIVDAKLTQRFKIKVTKPQDQEWGIRDFVLIDPSGVLWRIGNNI
ncbi:MAG: hypothetical protein RH862_10665 [Leptospiraceae bacterium]